MEDYGAARTNSQGMYSILLQTGTYEVEVEATANGFLTRRDRVYVSQRHHRADFSFAGFRVAGNVLDPNGLGLDSGWVTARLPNYASATSRLQNGRYVLFLPKGSYSLTARPADDWSGVSFMVWNSVPIASDTTIDLRLEEILVSGKVFGPDGAPMADVRVRGYAQDASGAAMMRTDADGTYQLYLPAGAYRFYFDPPFTMGIVPRVVGPLSVTAPTSVDCDLSGVVWSGAIRRSDTNAPVTALVYVAMLDEPDPRTAATSTDSQGVFRLVMERNRRYDLSAYDPDALTSLAKLHGIAATVDTTFEILVPPPPTP